MLKCSYCNRDLKNQGAKNLHERACEKNPENSQNKTKPFTNKPQHIHEFILLNERIPAQRKAIKDGFTIYCKTCNELE